MARPHGILLGWRYCGNKREAMNATYPESWEILSLLVAVGGLFAVGMLIRSHWASRNEPVPVSVAVFMWIGMVVVFCIVFSMFHFNNSSGHLPDPSLIAQGEGGLTLYNADGVQKDPRVRFGFWTVVFFLPAFAFYVWNVVDAFAARTVDRIGSMGAHIADPSEYAAARKLALKGDVDGAVALYRSYNENHEDALFEAARLLKGEKRYSEAAETLEEVAGLYYGKPRVWADAMYQLAKLKEQHLNRPTEAVSHLRLMLQRTSGGHYTELATADLIRLQHQHGDLDPDFDENDGGALPLKVPMGVESMDTMVLRGEDEGDEGAVDNYPAMDPFYLATIQRRAASAAVSMDGKPKAPRKKAVAKKKSAVKKKVATKKKTVVKKKAVAKKKGAARKRRS